MVDFTGSSPADFPSGNFPVSIACWQSDSLDHRQGRGLALVMNPVTATIGIVVL